MDLVFLGIMAPFFGFALVMLWVGTHVTKVKHRQKLEEMKLRASLDEAGSTQSAEQDSRIELLEDRVQVLERIITDKGYELAHQIEALRENGLPAAPARKRIKESR